ncbi:ATP synthase F1 subunit epsilon [Tissierella creatinophila]|uniref:ATP synthase epsilon chain n=1 Tax=Tissierella creatinophila DSM 6911 TaxID=1123403 RepID=A0A1U7M3K6_TISCR|nr:ATP synthase F1 subunit epsilon [Tissierella creatinophila]OLS01830.1 ATP synthase epsilon chain [Tissierella creatinophila DSM 6911]
MAAIHLEIVTPDRLFFNEDIDSIIVRGIEGDLAILKGRTPIVTPLKIGKIRIFQNGTERVASVTEGYVTAIEDNITIVTDAAEWPEEIDINRAERAKKRAEERLSGKSDMDLYRAEIALKRSINRLETSKYKK